MDIKLSIEHRQTLSLKQTVSVHILQLGAYELKEYIEKETLENPVIDFIEQQEYPLLKDTNFSKTDYDTNDVDYIEQINGEQDTQSLVEYLLWQIKLSNLSFDEIKNAAAICGFVEKSGYILTDTKTIAESCDITCEQAEKAVEFIQTLEPQGVGARNLSECLLLQLQPENQLEKTIVKNYLTQLAAGKINYISKQLNCDEKTVQRAVDKIKSLNPKPGAEFGKQTKSVFVLPDILVEVENKKAKAVLLNEKSFKININSTYLNLLKQTKDPQTIQYISQKIEKANWLCQCVENRNKTLFNVADEMIKHQNDFFIERDGKLKPLKLEDIAQKLSMHSSTVSRAVKDKYIQYPGKIIPLKNLFCSGVKNTYGQKQDTSVYTVKQRIKEIISLEDKNLPLSDQKISDILKKEGIECSRRTVAKYRESVGILSTNER